MLLFKINPSDFNGAFPPFDTPAVIGEMCVTKQREVLLGRSRVKYLCDKLMGEKCAFDLNIGYDIFDCKNRLDNDKLDILLKWICMHSEPGSSLIKVCHDANFVSWRGTLTRISCSPYERREGWRVAVVRYKSVIFLCEYLTDEKVQQIQTMTDREKIMSYWGFKFEQYVTSDLLSTAPNTNKPVTNFEEFDVVVKTRIGKREQGIRLLYSGETDCIDAGIVTQVEPLEVSELSKNAKEWSANVMLNFLLAMLKRIKEKLSVSPDLTYHLVEFSPSQNCVTFQALPPNSSFNFLPDWFLLHFNSA